MGKKFLTVFLCFSISLGGCAGKNFGEKLMPSERKLVGGNFHSYEEFEAFKNLIANKEIQTEDDLHRYGFDTVEPINTDILSRQSIRDKFEKNFFSAAYIPNGVRECLDEKIPGECKGYRIYREDTLSKGQGNPILYITRFKQVDLKIGYTAELTFVMKGNRITHFEWDARPHINELTVKKNPAIVFFGLILFLPKLIP